jgi:SAM-dependent methyltransferase
VNSLFPQPTLWSELAWRFQAVDRESVTCQGFEELASNLPADLREFVSDSYPRNHTYVPQADRLVPNQKLAVRVAGIVRYYPQPLTSLLDLSCSKGFFVYHAAAIESCGRALGIDLSGECLDACRQLQTRFANASRVNFAKLTLPELAERIDEFGGQFQTVLLLNTYQYLFFGSTVAPPVGQDHREIFRLLRKVCSGRVVFHNRLLLADLQSDPQARAAQAGTGALYRPQAIRDAAGEFFKVTELRRWLGRPIWLLDAAT